MIKNLKPYTIPAVILFFLVVIAYLAGNVIWVFYFLIIKGNLYCKLLFPFSNLDIWLVYYDKFLSTSAFLISLFTFIATIVFFVMNKESEKDKAKDERTYQYLSRWSNENTYKNYCKIQDLLSKIQKENKALFNDDYSVNEATKEEYNEKLTSYINDPANAEYQDSLYYIFLILHEIIFLADNKYLNDKILKQVFYDEIKHVWKYYKDYFNTERTKNRRNFIDSVLNQWENLKNE